MESISTQESTDHFRQALERSLQAHLLSKRCSRGAVSLRWSRFGCGACPDSTLFQNPHDQFFPVPATINRPGAALAMTSTLQGLDLSLWARLWSLIVLRYCLHSQLSLELPLVD